MGIIFYKTKQLEVHENLCNVISYLMVYTHLREHFFEITKVTDASNFIFKHVYLSSFFSN